MKITLKVFASLMICGFSISSVSFAGKRGPRGQRGFEKPKDFVTADISVCKNGSKVLPINEIDVLDWKLNSDNQFEERAHIDGKIYVIYPDKNSHDHFGVQFGTDSQETIEVIYNKSFGSLPKLEIGDEVSACGDYITSNAPAGPYPASPDLAILHWVHRSNSPTKHEHGFVKVNGVLYGNGSASKK